VRVEREFRKMKLFAFLDHISCKRGGIKLLKVRDLTKCSQRRNTHG
jgi:hypothetical protein